jgi:hypothetical protein
VLRENWTDAEARHRAVCSHCKEAEQLARTSIWHPSLVDLFRQARDLSDTPDIDTVHHLRKDACRRCLRLTSLLGIDRILTRLAAQIRSGMADAAGRLSRALATGAVASLALASGGTAGQAIAFEDGEHSVRLVSDRPARLCLELPARDKNPAPRLIRVLVGDAQTSSDHLIVPRPAGSSDGLTAVFAPPALPARTICLTLYEVDASLLAQEDAPLLRSAYASACKLDPPAQSAWQSWAAAALQRPDLNGVLRPILSSVARPDPGKPVV